jgi:hypothetical protein
MHTCDYCSANGNWDICRNCQSVLCSHCLSRHDKFDIHEPLPWLDETNRLCCFCTENYKKKVFKDSDITKFLLKMAKKRIKEKYKIKHDITESDIKDIMYKKLHKKGSKKKRNKTEISKVL